MKYLIDHHLGLDLALRATHAAMASYAERFQSHSPRLLWESKTRVRIAFDVKGHTVDGLIEIHDQNLEIDIAVPLLFRVFESPAVAVVKEEIKSWAHKAQAGQI